MKELIEEEAHLKVLIQIRADTEALEDGSGEDDICNGVYAEIYACKERIKKLKETIKQTTHG